MNTAEKLGKRLKEERERNNFTQEEFGGKFNLKKQYISYYENGKREPGIDLVVGFAKELKVSTDYLLGLSEFKTPVDENICKITGIEQKEITDIISLSINKILGAFRDLYDTTKVPEKYKKYQSIIRLGPNIMTNMLVLLRFMEGAFDEALTMQKVESINLATKAAQKERIRTISESINKVIISLFNDIEISQEAKEQLQKKCKTQEDKDFITSTSPNSLLMALAITEGGTLESLLSVLNNPKYNSKREE